VVYPTKQVWFTRPTKYGLPDRGSVVYPTDEVWFTRPRKCGLPDRVSMVWPVEGSMDYPAEQMCFTLSKKYGLTGRKKYGLHYKFMNFQSSRIFKTTAKFIPRPINTRVKKPGLNPLFVPHSGNFTEQEYKTSFIHPFAQNGIYRIPSTSLHPPTIFPKK